ncbi:hypothetical protein BJ742DRAFT_871660 [Cladochytrium replicatum]|nr:hypothetical protein BJ742DRAFT_871660 [Cladochytrium replicatum]
MEQTVEDFPPLFPIQLPVHGETYVAPPGGIVVKMKELSFGRNTWIMNSETNEKLVGVNHGMVFKDPATDKTICYVKKTTFNKRRPVNDAADNRVWKLCDSNLLPRHFSGIVKSLADGKDYEVSVEPAYGSANIFVKGPEGQTQLAAVDRTGLFKNEHAIKVAEGMDLVVVAVFLTALDLSRGGAAAAVGGETA